MILKVNNLTKVFGIDEVVKRVSFDLNESDYVAIVGPAGSGKTTLMSMISGMLSITEGDVIFNSIKMSSMKRQELSKFRADKIGLIFQFSELISDLTLKENILLPALMTKKFTKKEYLERCDSLLDSLELTEFQNKVPSELSGGQIQKGAIIRSLINEPELLLADEPSGDLDPNNRELVKRLFKKYNATKKLSILLVTHDMNLGLDANTTFEMREGRFIKVVK